MKLGNWENMMMDEWWCSDLKKSLHFMWTALLMSWLTCDQKKEPFSLCKIYNKRLRLEVRGQRRTCPATDSLSACIRILCLLVSPSRHPGLKTHFSAEAGPWQEASSDSSAEDRVDVHHHREVGPIIQQDIFCVPMPRFNVFKVEFYFSQWIKPGKVGTHWVSLRWTSMRLY